MGGDGSKEKEVSLSQFGDIDNSSGSKSEESEVGVKKN